MCASLRFSFESTVLAEPLIETKEFALEEAAVLTVGTQGIKMTSAVRARFLAYVDVDRMVFYLF
jgi:hypothetical protein